MTQEPQLNKLCLNCQYFTLCSLSCQGRRLGFLFHDINGLLQSAKDGCHPCNLMVAELPKSKIQILQRELELDLYRSSRQLYISVDDPDMAFRDGNRLLRLSLRHWRADFTSKQDLMIPIIITEMHGTMVRRGASDTGSRENLEMIKAWIKHCDERHSDCKTSVQTTARLPTRLLKIEKSGESFKIKLCVSSALSPSTSYATLSHAWGSGSPMTLVNENLLRCQQDIPLASLPQTFADAIRLTNALGLSYLWIDSLCIIQDSTLDWEVESTTMCDVYRGSTINIAASASVDCNGGLFRQRNNLSVTPCIIDVGYKRKEAGDREEGPYALSCEIACDRDPLVAEPLSRRAWAVQERILAPRTVYFTARKVYFACYKKMTSDVDPCSFIRYNGYNEDLVNTWTFSRPALVPHSPTLDLGVKNWKRVVQQYTHGQLSFESDKLVAIAGLAKHMQRTWLPNITYLAGLWSFELIDGLMWRRSITLGSLARPKPYRGPSWSWASVEGEVEWEPNNQSPNKRFGASIIEARTSPTGNPYGSVHGGYIHIRGKFYTWRDVAKVDTFWDVVSVNGRDDREHIPTEADGLMFFLVREVREEKAGCRPFSCVEGLVLEYTRSKKGQYKRLGVFKDKLDYALPISRSFCLAEHLFLEAGRDGLYTIEII